jgi:hypothetical protein
MAALFKSNLLSDEEAFRISTNLFVKSPREESYRDGCDKEEGVPMRPGAGLA